MVVLALASIGGAGPAAAATDFPAGDEGYHTYAEMVDAIQRRSAPTRTSCGSSRSAVVRGADPVGGRGVGPRRRRRGRAGGAARRASPRARAHVRRDDAGGLRVADRRLRRDPRITGIVDSRRVWFVFMVNPDGGEYDIASGAYHDWRRNRQPTPGTDLVGTDVNRNYGYRWGCCGGASRDPSSSRFGGPRAFSTPEARAMRDFVESRVGQRPAADPHPHLVPHPRPPRDVPLRVHARGRAAGHDGPGPRGLRPARSRTRWRPPTATRRSSRATCTSAPARSPRGPTRRQRIFELRVRAHARGPSPGPADPARDPAQPRGGAVPAGDGRLPLPGHRRCGGLVRPVLRRPGDRPGLAGGPRRDRQRDGRGLEPGHRPGEPVSSGPGRPRARGCW